MSDLKAVESQAYKRLEEILETVEDEAFQDRCVSYFEDKVAKADQALKEDQLEHGDEEAAKRHAQRVFLAAGNVAELVELWKKKNSGR